MLKCRKSNSNQSLFFLTFSPSHFLTFGFWLLCNTTTKAQDSTLISEQFYNNSNHWTIGKAKNYDCSIAEGFYSIHNSSLKEDFKTYIQANIDVDKENFSVETNISPCKKEDKNNYGLLFGLYADLSDYHVFSINSSGEFKIDHYYQRSWHPLQNWKTSDAVSKTGKNKLALKREYNCVYFYINNVLVYASCEYKGFGHGFGFYTEAGTCMNADYLIVKKWAKKFPAPDISLSGKTKEQLSKKINSNYSELSPFIAYDGKTLYFSRLGDPLNTGGEKDYDIWYSVLNADGTWSEARNAGPPLNNTGANALQSISPDNNTVLLSNVYRPDGSPDGNGLSYSNYQLNGWEVPKKFKINNFVNHNEYVDYFLSSDNKILLCAIDNGKSYGLKDIYVCFLQADFSFSEPLNLGPVINTPGEEFGIYLAADNKTLYFSSYGHESYGSADIFMSKRLDNSWKNWSSPINLGPEINSENWDGAFKISAKGDYAYLSCKNEHSIAGSEDIYRINLNATARPEPVLLIKGKVLNSKDQQPLSANITYSDLKDNTELGLASSNPIDGSYKIVLPAGKAYSFLADKNGYYSISENIKTDTLNNYIEIERNLYLAPIEVGQTILLNNIFFEFDKADLQPESIAELNRLIKALQDYPGLVIEIAGHTDDVGTDEYNLNLSHNRAHAVMNYLLNKNISPDRLKGRGFGESKAVAANDTEEGRALNRRVEFTIVQK